jgi:hypothetical protein
MIYTICKYWNKNFILNVRPKLKLSKILAPLETLVKKIKLCI